MTGNVDVGISCPSLDVCVRRTYVLFLCLVSCRLCVIMILMLMLISAPGGETAEEQRRYNNRWMFTPATVLSAVDPEPGVVLIRTKDQEVHR